MSLNFGIRKIQKVKYSYLTTLPVQWVESMKLFKNDSLRIEMQDNYRLRISPVPHALKDYEGTGGRKPILSKEKVSVWKI